MSVCLAMPAMCQQARRLPGPTQQAEDGARGTHSDQVAEQKGGNAAAQAREKVDCRECAVAHDSLNIRPDAEEGIAVQAQVKQASMQECARQQPAFAGYTMTETCFMLTLQCIAAALQYQYWSLGAYRLLQTFKAWSLGSMGGGIGSTESATELPSSWSHLYSSPLATLSFILAKLRNQSFEKSLPCVMASPTPTPYTARFRNRRP